MKGKRLEIEVVLCRLPFGSLGEATFPTRYPYYRWEARYVDVGDKMTFDEFKRGESTNFTDVIDQIRSKCFSDLMSEEVSVEFSTIPTIKLKSLFRGGMKLWVGDFPIGEAEFLQLFASLEQFTNSYSNSLSVENKTAKSYSEP